MKMKDEEINRILEKKMREILARYKREDHRVEKSERIIYNVTDNDFMEKVIKKSHEKPVIVDFWAEWCGPCHLLSPELESAVETFKGRVLLAKLNVDYNPITAGRYGIISIPTVIMFKDGDVSDYFVGALPREEIVRWIRKNLY
jgi:thioredoxin